MKTRRAEATWSNAYNRITVSPKETVLPYEENSRKIIALKLQARKDAYSSMRTRIQPSPHRILERQSFVTLRKSGEGHNISTTDSDGIRMSSKSDSMSLSTEFPNIERNHVKDNKIDLFTERDVNKPHPLSDLISLRDINDNKSDNSINSSSFHSIR